MISRVLNEAYSRLEAKQREINAALLRQTSQIKSGWYNGHYQRAADGEWVRNAFPIPEVDVIDLCDIEIHYDRISVTTKLKRDAALAYSFDKLMDYEFEAYGVEDYLGDYYHPGQSAQELKDNINACSETEIGFSFTFPFDVRADQLFEFVELLRREGFYY